MRGVRVRLIPIAAVLAIAIPVAGTSIAPAAKGEPKGSGAHPWPERVRAATRFVRARSGSASFAVIDERGRIHAYRRGVQYSSASLVKAMLLVAYLRRGDVRHRRLRGSERSLLGPMIRVSDNDAATAIYGRVGASGLSRLARRAGMRRFVPNPVWGGSQVTARDQARFFFRIRGLVPKRHRSYALGLLRRIVPAQRWGIPRARPPGWRIHFKGGWTPDDDGWRVHQAALLRQGHRKLAVAILTRGNPSLDYGAETIAGVTARLLRGFR
jgi:hypothetical protein